MSPKNPIVGFQGEFGAFSETAARAYFHESVDLMPRPSFQALFEAVVDGECTHAIVPIENSLAGSIHENFDLLLRFDVSIVGEIKLRIVHNLIVNPGVRLEEIRRIHSHPQALAQCSDFIRSLEDVEAIVDYDTAGAVKRLQETGERAVAAIAGAQAAIDYDLEVLREGIENNHQNYTRFLVVSREGIAVEGDAPAKTSIVFSMDSVPGALFKTLGVFALRDINLLKIESRPQDGKPWEYVFYLDFEGHMDVERCAQAAEHLEQIASFVKVLGCYTPGETVEGTVREKRTAP